MTIRENAQQILDGLAETLQCGPLAFDDANKIDFGIDDDMGAIIYLSEDTSSLVVSIIPGRVDPDDTGLLYDILCGNYMWGFSAGGNMGIDRETGLLSIHRLIELPVDVAGDPMAFPELFAAMVGAARYWRARLAPEGTAPAASGAPTDFSGMIRI